MCSGAVILYNIPRVVIGENTTLMGAENLLKCNDVEVVVLNDMKCRDMFLRFTCNNCEIWDEELKKVGLLSNFSKTVGCASFKVYDSESAEIVTLFLNSYDDRERISYKLIRQLEKIAMDYEFKSIVVSFDSKEDILIEIFEKLDYRFVDDLLMKKEFKSLI